MDSAPQERPSTYAGRRKLVVPTGSAAYTTGAENHPKVDVPAGAATLVQERIEQVTEQATGQATGQATEDATGRTGQISLDTGTIERVLSDLEPVDHTTSFEHEPTAQLPLLRAARPAPTTTTVATTVTSTDTTTVGPQPATAPLTSAAGGGKRRAVKHAGGRGPLFRGLPSAPVLLGIAALAISVGGAVTAGQPQQTATADVPEVTHAASALGGATGQGRVSSRDDTVSRDSARDAQADAADQELKAAAEGLAKERNSELKVLAGNAEEYAKELAKDVWEYPLQPVVLTARFGQYGLWSSYHTGLDFNGNTGDQIHSISNGEVISAGYDGSYGNKTVVRLEDGTEIWYCHQSAFNVSVGDTVTRGEVLGLVGATGNVTGSHLHVEVRPGGGDPVDPYTAMQQHGLF